MLSKTMLVSSAIPPFLMNHLEKKAFLKVRTLNLKNMTDFNYNLGTSLLSLMIIHE